MPLSPISWTNLPLPSVGIGVLMRFKAPPIVLGPCEIADGPLRTSTAWILPVVGK